MFSRENTLLVKFASIAISKTYDSGRTPLVDAFSISNVIGCLSTAILAPLVGSRILGVVISTPGIGPATVGVSGLELFVVTHAPAASGTVTTPAPGDTR